MTDEETQEAVHDALQEALGDDGVITGWVVAFETLHPDDERTGGHLYGPGTQTAWGALGLLEWARQHTIGNDDD